MQLGESFVGDGVHAAHVNTMVGSREGPVGHAWATALATPSLRHAPFVVVMQPGLPVKPYTLFVNKAPIESDEHGELTWGAAQAGVAGGVARALRDGVVELNNVLIAAVWVNPKALMVNDVFENNREATYNALLVGARDEPTETDVLGAIDDEWNAYFRPRR
ncbi:MAG TPA: formaldehyde-activating enzyme [Acidimicrobiales bacterium]|nr:formaldehyde-activating enzyme [Acidimicrobiales bacterium]